MEDVAKNRDMGKTVILIMCDCSKAFDTISRDILLKKLETMGIVSKALALLKSYLTFANKLLKLEIRIVNVLLLSLEYLKGQY